MTTPVKKKDNVLSAIAKINAIQTVALHTDLIARDNLSRRPIINAACEDAKSRLKNLTNKDDITVDKIVYDVSTMLVKAIRNDDLDYENEENKLKLQAAVADIDTMIAINDENEATIALKDTEIKTLQTTKQRLTQDLIEMKKKYDETNKILVNSLADNKTFIDYIFTLEKKQKLQEAEIATLTQERNDALDKIQKLDVQILKLIAKKKKAENKIDQCKVSIDNLNSLNTELSDVNTKNTEQLLSLQAELKNQLDLDQSNVISDHLRTIIDLNQEIKILKINQLTNEKARIAQLEGELSESDAVNAIYLESANRRTTVIELLQKEVIRIQTEIDNVKKELDQRLKNAETERGNLYEVLETLKYEFNELSKLERDLSTRHGRLTQENTALLQQNKELTAINVSLHTLSQNINAQMGTMKKDLLNPEIIELFGKYGIPQDKNGKYGIKNYVDLLLNIAAENKTVTRVIDRLWRQYAGKTQQLDKHQSENISKLDQISTLLASQSNQIESNYQNLINILNVLFSKDGEGSTLLFTIQQAANSGNLKRMIGNYTTHIQPMITTINNKIDEIFKITKDNCNDYIQNVINILPGNSGWGIVITTATHTLKTFLKDLINQDVVKYDEMLNELSRLLMSFYETTIFNNLDDTNKVIIQKIVSNIQDAYIKNVSELIEYLNTKTLLILQKYIQSNGVTEYIDRLNQLNQLNLQFSTRDQFGKCIKYYSDIKKIYDDVVQFIESDDKSFDVTQNDRQMINEVMKQIEQSGKATPNSTDLSVKMFIRAMYKSAFELAKDGLILEPIENSTVYTFKDITKPTITISDALPQITLEQNAEFDNLSPFAKLFYTWLFVTNFNIQKTNGFIQTFLQNLVSNASTNVPLVNTILEKYKNEIVHVYLNNKYNNKYNNNDMYDMMITYHKKTIELPLYANQLTNVPNPTADMLYLLISKQEFLLYLKLYLISQLILSNNRPINKQSQNVILPNTDLTDKINKLHRHDQQIWVMSKEFFSMFNDFIYKIFYLTRYDIPNTYNINITTDDISGIESLKDVLENYNESVTAEVIRVNLNNNKPLPLFNYIGVINDIFNKMTNLDRGVKGGAYANSYGGDENITNSAIVAAGLSIGTILYYGFSGLIIFIVIMVIYYLCSKIYTNQISRNDEEYTSGFNGADPFGYSGGVLLNDIYKPLNYSEDYLRENSAETSSIPYQEGMSSYYSYPQIGPAIYT